MFKTLFGSDGIGSMLDLPVVVMLFFLAVFLLVLVRVFSRQRKPHYDRMARLPLEEASDGELKEVVR